MRSALPLSLSLAVAGFLSSTGWALTTQETEFFEKKVRPVLAEHCYKCHGAEKQKGDLRVDSRAAILKGIDGVPSAVPGKPEESPLVKSIRHEGESKMPAKEPKLADEDITAISDWVRQGMPWPDSDQPVQTSQQSAGSKHWSFQPITNPAPPAVADPTHWSQSPVDQFVLARQEAAHFAPSPKADKRTLIRRATFDLIGLPPTATEVESFEKDDSTDAFAKVIDRLLASPRYGERWGRHWLDVARYADTRGYLAGGEERNFAYSYTYRDWVIKALNSDLPYDQFIIQQLAADQALAPGGDTSSLAAMGYLTLGRRFLNNVHDIIDDRIDVVSRGMMGLTVACARCHDHKFDPIAQKDYYALYGIFASSKEPADLPLLPDTRDEKTKAEYDAELAKRMAPVDEFYAKARDQRGWVLSLTLGLPIAVPALEKTALNRAEREKVTQIFKKVGELNASPLAPPRAMVLNDAETLTNPRVFLRGNPGRPGDAVPRRFLTVLSQGEPKPFPTGSGRLDLAKAIASKNNPLTARVIVNRVWAYHFGKGLVRTPGDFGIKGEPPTHPELLDYLATRFMAEGWSLKKLHRTIMLTSAYQQSSEISDQVAQGDPENRLLTRMNRQRLDFEALHDSLLCVAGELDLKEGGQPVELTKPPFAKRRAVYGYIDRQNLPGIFRTFDLASPDTTSPQRHITTVPQQALFMMNSPFVLERTQALTKKLSVEGEPKPEEIQALYKQVLSRAAQAPELQLGSQFVSTQLQLRPVEEELPIWRYGYGMYDSDTKAVSFTAFKTYQDKMWKGGPKLPDPVSGFAFLTADGGHGGSDVQRSTIRRWTAPSDLVVDVNGTLTRPAAAGDGVLVRIVSSRDGQLAEFVCDPTKTVETNISAVSVKKGDYIDFIVEPRADSNSDSFTWAPVIHTPLNDWDSRLGFAGTPPPREPPLSAWEKYTHVILSTNEFMFVD